MMLNKDTKESNIKFAGASGEEYNNELYERLRRVL